MPKISDALQTKAKLFRGLSDTSRLSILEALRDGPANVSQVVARTGLSQPNTSMHLDCLWCCGLVEREVEGRFTYYRIASRRVLRLLQAAEHVLELVQDRIQRCTRYSERKNIGRPV